MKEILKYVFCLTSIIFIQTSCNNHATKDNSNADKFCKITLTKKPIGESGYLISIPVDYSIKKFNGPNSSIYFFSPTDSTVKDKLSGGLYFFSERGNFFGGNDKKLFDPDNDSCKIETLKGEIFDNMLEWTVYNCQGEFKIQTIAYNIKGEHGNERVHVFGHSNNKDDLELILEIFSTLKKKSQLF